MVNYCNYCKKELLDNILFYINNKVYCSIICSKKIIDYTIAPYNSKKYCSTCYNILSNDKRWYCESDKLYCSKNCREINRKC